MNLFNHVGDLTPVEMTAEMVDGKRVYLTPSGKQYPSITTVIRLAIMLRSKRVLLSGGRVSVRRKQQQFLLAPQDAVQNTT